MASLTGTALPSTSTETHEQSSAQYFHNLLRHRSHSYQALHAKVKEWKRRRRRDGRRGEEEEEEGRIVVEEKERKGG
jgi:hypothetical protein